MKEVRLPEELAGYQTYINPGLIPGPIATPTLPSIDAALEPDTADKYLYFVAIPDGGGKHAFAKTTKALHEAPQEVRLPCDRPAGRSRRTSRAPPTAEQRAGWAAADRAARPARLARLRARFAAAGVDAYFGVRPEHTRYLTGVVLGEGEEKVAGQSGQFLVGARRGRRSSPTRATRSRRATRGARRPARRGLPRPAEPLAGPRRVRRGAARGGRGRLRARRRPGRGSPRPRPDVELVPVEGWVEADRAVKEAGRARARRRGLRGRRPRARGAAARDPAGRDRGRPRAAARVADADRRRRGARVRRGVPGRSAGGPAARVARRAAGRSTGAVLLFDFGAQVDGYRSDMTRTLFVGEPTARDLEVYELVARRPGGGDRGARGGRRGRRRAPDGRLDRCRRAGRHRGGRSRRALRPRHGPRDRARDPRGAEPRHGPPPRRRCPSPTVFSVEPGRLPRRRDRASASRTSSCSTPTRGRVERLTRFPREVIVVGG